MIVFEKINELKKHLSSERRKGKTVGFVPTMGALHQGHIALISRAKKETDIVVCSIYVNPTQFNDKNDLAKYPRPIEADKALLEKNNCDILFLPSSTEMYPNGEVSEEWNFGQLDKVMEGAHRPGHFNGVATIVNRFFQIVEPDLAFFGQKDFQQLAIIRAMVIQTNSTINIIACPTLRESDGLAMSSRNVRLTNEDRKAAPLIFKTLSWIKDNFQSKSVKELVSDGKKQLASIPNSKLEYLEIVNEETLLNTENKNDLGVVCVALKLGDVRLIDNVKVN